MENNNNNRAVASLVLGLVSIVTWLLPDCRIYYNHSGNCICNKGTSQ